MKQTQHTQLRAAASWTKPVLLLTTALFMAQASLADESLPIQVPDASIAAVNPQHWMFHCKHKDPIPPPTDPSIVAPAPAAPPADPNKVSDDDMLGNSAQYSITRVADFPTTGGEDNLNLFAEGGKSYYVQSGEKLTQVVGIATLGVCDNVDVSVTLTGAEVQTPDVGSHAGMGDSNVTMKWQFYNNPDHAHYTVSSAAEVSLNGDTKHAYDQGYGDPTSVAVSLQHGIMFDDVGQRVGPIEVAMPSVNAGLVYTHSMNPQMANSNIALGLGGATNFRVNYGADKNIRGSILAEGYHGKNVGAFSNGATQNGRTFALTLKAGSSCWQPSIVRSTVNDSISGKVTTTYLAFSKTIDVHSHACSN